MVTVCKSCDQQGQFPSGYCPEHNPANLPITIEVFIIGGDFYCNATHGSSFICTTAQPTLDMSLASVMSWVRQEVDTLQLNM